MINGSSTGLVRAVPNLRCIEFTPYSVAPCAATTVLEMLSQFKKLATIEILCTSVTPPNPSTHVQDDEKFKTIVRLAREVLSKGGNKEGKSLKLVNRKIPSGHSWSTHKDKYLTIVDTVEELEI